MSQENIEIVSAFLDAYNRGDLDSAFEYLHPDIESRGYEGRDERGRELAIEGFLCWRQEWESFTSELDEFIDLGDDRAVVICRDRGRGRRSGAEIQAQTGEIWAFKDGKISGLFQYRNAEEALEAAGLRE
jgi:ketosteroid isomerase-like protein